MPDHIMKALLQDGGFGETIQGTRDVDVVVVMMQNSSSNLGSFHVCDLADFTLEKSSKDEFIIKNTTSILNPNRKITLKGFDPAIDKIRTSDGDFTLQEIFDYGNNAPIYKRAKIIVEEEKKAGIRK